MWGTFGLVMISLACALSWHLAKRSQNTERLKRAQYLYEAGIACLKDGDYVQALAILSQATGWYPAHQPFNAIGLCWEEFERFGEAAEAFRKARNAVSPSPPWEGRIQNAEEVCEYYHSEAQAYLRDQNWEFAYIRAREGIALIEVGHLPRYVEYGDCESWLRLVRMIGAAHHLEGEEALKIAAADAEWLLNHSKVKGYDRMARAILDSGGDLMLARDRVHCAWEEYDEPRRQRPPFIEGED